MPNNFSDTLRWVVQLDTQKKLHEQELAQQKSLAEAQRNQQMQEFMMQHGLAQEEARLNRERFQQQMQQNINAGIAEGIYETPQQTAAASPTVTGQAPLPATITPPSQNANDITSPNIPSTFNLPSVTAGTGAYTAPAFQRPVQDLGGGIMGSIVPKTERMTREAAAQMALKRQESFINAETSKQIASTVFGLKEGTPEYETVAYGLPFRPPSDFQGLMVDRALKMANGDPKKALDVLNPMLGRFYGLVHGPQAQADAILTTQKTKDLMYKRVAENYRLRILRDMKIDPAKNPGLAMREYTQKILDMDSRGEFGKDPNDAAGIKAALMSIGDNENAPYRMPMGNDFVGQLLQDKLGGAKGLAKPAAPGELGDMQ